MLRDLCVGAVSSGICSGDESCLSVRIYSHNPESLSSGDFNELFSGDRNMSERGECQLIYYSFFTSTAEKQLKVAPVRAHMCVCVRERMCVCVCVCV